MGFKVVQSLDAEKAITIGGRDKKANKANPTKAEGYYLGSRVIPGSKYGESTLHFLQTNDGNLGVWGKTDLNKKLGGVTPGTMTRITYSGTKPTKNGDMHTYKVETDDENTIEVAEGLSASDDSSYSEESGDGQESEQEEPQMEEEEQQEEQAAPVAQVSADRKAKVQALLNKGKKQA